MYATKHHVVASAQPMQDIKHHAKIAPLMQAVYMQATELCADDGFLSVFRLLGLTGTSMWQKTMRVTKNVIST